MALPTHITHEPADPDAWVCLCGNTPTLEGFLPCDVQGRPVSPTPQDWTTNAYVCNRCGRIIEDGSLEIVGQAEKDAAAP
ncbi:MAG: hypothetical protein V1907_01315 [Candidatus Kerfeldbacteria bacterium]